MKKSVQIPRYAVVLLIVGFMLSLIVNVIQFEKNSSDVMRLSGTYSNNSPNPEGVYMAFDNKGHFCTYTQKDGITEEGNYIESKENLYELKGVSGYCGFAVLTEDGIYFSTQSGTMDFLPRIDDMPIFIGNWTEDWDHWPDGQYKIN